MKDYLTIIIVSLLIITVFISAIEIGEDSLGNSLLNDDSKDLIEDISKKQSQDFDESNFDEGDNTLAENDSTFDSEDTFSREFLEGRSDAQKKTNIAERITKIPDLILISLGVPREFVTPFLWIITTLLSIFIAFATYRAFFGGGRVTEK